MIYLLDTNCCIRYLKGNPRVIRRLSSLLPSDIAVCSVVKAELFYGAMRSNDPTRTLRVQQRFLEQFVSLPFDDRAGLIHGQIRAQLTAAGTLIGPYDFQIAAIALANNLTLITHNTREFRRVEGLQIEDWEAAGDGN